MNSIEDAVKSPQLSKINRDSPKEVLALVILLLREISKHVKGTTFDDVTTAKEAAHLIISKKWYLRLGEIKLVLDRLKIGHYGKSYGAVDLPFIFECFERYEVSERDVFIENRNKELNSWIDKPLEVVDYDEYKERSKSEKKEVKDDGEDLYRKFKSDYIKKRINSLKSGNSTDFRK